jgi:hypothetical protein
MAVGDSATVLPIRHDWAAPPERARTYPSVVLPHDDGSEQRLALSHVATDTVTYRILAPSAADATHLAVLPELAADTWVRVPRWEDEARVGAAVSAGAGVVIPCDTTDKPLFTVGGQVILWRSPSSYEVTTATAVAADSVTATIANDWAAGTIIAPVRAGRLVYPLSLTHWLPTTGALTLAIVFSLGDIAGVGSGGASATASPAAIVVSNSSLVGKYGRGVISAIVTDAVGNVIPAAITWTSADPANAPVYASGTPGVAVVENPNGVTSNVTITGAVGAFSDTGTARLVG